MSEIVESLGIPEKFAEEFKKLKNFCDKAGGEFEVSKEGDNVIASCVIPDINYLYVLFHVSHDLDSPTYHCIKVYKNDWIEECIEVSSFEIDRKPTELTCGLGECDARIRSEYKGFRITLKLSRKRTPYLSLSIE